MPAPDQAVKRPVSRRAGAVRRHPIRTALGAAAALLVVGGVILPAVAAVALLQARDAAERGEAALSAGDVATAHPALEESHSAFRTARLALHNPAVWAARLLPGLGHNLGAAGAVARAGELTAAAGTHSASALLDLPGGVAALAPRDGAVPLEPLEQIAPVLRTAAELLAEASAEIETAPDVLLAAPVADAVGQMRARIHAVAPGAAAGAGLAEQLPAFLGVDGPRRYFFGAANPAEARGSGGFLGAFAVMEVDRGRLTLNSFRQVQDFRPVRIDLLEPPNPDFAARYDRFGSPGFLPNSNMSPDFPSVAVAILRLYEHHTGEALDGVVLADPFAFAALLEVAGPAQVEDIGRVDHATVVDFVANQAYASLGPGEERKEALGAVAAAVLQGVLHGSGDAQTTARALAATAAGGHLLLYATDPDVQHAFAAAGVDGAIPSEGDYVNVVVNNSANNKVDFYLHRAVRYQLELTDEGSATGRVDVQMRNDAPTEGPGGHVLGPNVEGFAPGDNRSILTLLCACRLEVFERDRRVEQPVVEQELGRAAYTTEVLLGSGAATALTYDVTVPQAWTPGAGGDTGSYRLTFGQQSLIVPTDVELEVRVPDGMVVTYVSGADWQVEGRTVRFTAQTRADVAVEIRFARPERAGWAAAARRFLNRELISW
jgi:hypothetical protein